MIKFLPVKKHTGEDNVVERNCFTMLDQVEVGVSFTHSRGFSLPLPIGNKKSSPSQIAVYPFQAEIGIQNTFHKIFCLINSILEKCWTITKKYIWVGVVNLENTLIIKLCYIWGEEQEWQIKWKRKKKRKKNKIKKTIKKKKYKR